MLRNILSIIAGLISSFIMIQIIEVIGYKIYPPPSNIDFTNMEAIKTFISSAPAIIFILVIIGYATGSFAGGLVASLIAAHNKIKNALTVGGILMGLGLFNLITIPHPVWVIIGGLIVFLPFAYFGGKLGIKFTDKKEQ